MLFVEKPDHYVVRIPKQEVLAFKARWPASGLPSQPVEFRFEKVWFDTIYARPLQKLSKADPGALAVLTMNAASFAAGQVGRQYPHARPSPRQKEEEFDPFEYIVNGIKKRTRGQGFRPWGDIYFGHFSMMNKRWTLRLDISMTWVTPLAGVVHGVAFTPDGRSDSVSSEIDSVEDLDAWLDDLSAITLKLL